jgi:hypothetical protein
MPIMNFMTSYFPEIHGYISATGALLKKSLILLVILVPLIAVSSCTETPTVIGNDILPSGDFTAISSTDTIVPRTYNVILDSVIASKITNSFIGGLHSSYFGDTYTDFVAQLRLTQAWPGGVPTVDSVKFFFSIKGAKGDRTFNPSIRLDETSEHLSTDSTYYSSRDPHDYKLLGTFPLGEITKDTITSFTLNLPNSFGEYLLRDTTRLNQDGTSTDFRNFFKGLHVSLVEGAIPVKKKGTFTAVPEMLVIDPTTTTFLFRIYYHTPKSTTLLYFDFQISDKSARYNRYFHDLSTADPSTKIKYVNQEVLDSITCVQSMYGVSGKIRISALEHYKTMMPLSVNKAKMVFHVMLDGSEFTSTNAPSKIYLAYRNADGTRSIIQDYSINSSFYGGAFSSSSSTYSFNISAFVQAYLDGKVPNPELEMYLPDGETTSTVLKSVGSSNPPTFTFVYTRF